MSSDRLLLEHRKPLSLSRAHKRLAAFVDRQIAAQPTLPSQSTQLTNTLSPVDEVHSGAQLRAVDRVKVADHILYQLTRIRESIEEERQREKGQQAATTTQLTADNRVHSSSSSGVSSSTGSRSSGNGRTEGARKQDKKRKRAAH